jgi:hypothetical protein
LHLGNLKALGILFSYVQNRLKNCSLVIFADVYIGQLVKNPGFHFVNSLNPIARDRWQKMSYLGPIFLPGTDFFYLFARKKIMFCFATNVYF